MAAVAATASGVAPNSTIYVRNLEERIKIESLKEALTEIFSEYGNIIDIVAKTNLKAKGQAFVVFDNVDSATRAIEEINGFELFEKPMVLDYAKTRSDATVLKEQGEAELEAHKRKRLAEKAQEALEAQKKLKRGAAAPGGAETRPSKVTRGTGLKPSNAAAAPVIPDEYLPPNKILFLREIPDSLDQEGLTAVFGRFEGFKEVRMVPGRKGIAFVEYEAETGAISAKEATSGMPLGENGKPIRVTYQRQ
ncbi:small nuclear ribonucleoprotein U [Histoplasma capsulatum]|uniref:Small nuclear ribonucleoprotein U n=1 Tax=Ajellomyces capsulatus TaxID=5037 RepID=A0A8A1MI78_AJECA|nr:small nuclear ribonucleoprotein U [Histoplasma capsulatum]